MTLDGPTSPLTQRRITQTWWPLAAGWFFMTVEIPFLNAVIARNLQPQIHLAAWGLVFAVALMLASPIMMLLSASTALSRDWPSYGKLNQYSWLLSLSLTAFHAILAYTPLFDIIVVGVLAPPPEVVEPSRLGLRIMLPYVIGLAYRRFNYGVLIRFNRTRAVTIGAFFRLVVDVITYVILHLAGVHNGIVLATTIISMGVVAEAAYSGVRVHAVLPELRTAPHTGEPVTLAGFTHFYMPLVMTSLLMILVQPMGAAGLSRMPNPLQSLAVWPVINSLIILWTSAGTAFTEAVVVLLDEPRAVTPLHNFTLRMGSLMVGLLLVMNVTPLAKMWFEYVAALPPELSPTANWALWLALLMPGLAFLQSWYTGTLVNGRHTRGVTEAVLLALVINGVVLAAGVLWGNASGVYVAVVGLVGGNIARTVWLFFRTRTTMRRLRSVERSLVPAAGKLKRSPAS